MVSGGEANRESEGGGDYRDRKKRDMVVGEDEVGDEEE